MPEPEKPPTIVGTCGQCSGPVVQPAPFVSRDGQSFPPRRCAKCGRIPKNTPFGPRIEMQESRVPSNVGGNGSTQVDVG